MIGVNKMKNQKIMQNIFDLAEEIVLAITILLVMNRMVSCTELIFKPQPKVEQTENTVDEVK